MKILEVVESNWVKPIGGKNGYIYNLCEGLKDNEIELFFMPELHVSLVKKVKIPKLLKDFLKVFYEIKKIKKIARGSEVIDNINQYDIIHFHSDIDMAKFNNQLETYKGKIILTCHPPLPSFCELYEDYFSKCTKILCGKILKNKYKKLCEKSFYRADYIIFPCNEADESYFSYWPEYLEIKNHNINKYLYLPTGCKKKNPNFNCEIDKLISDKNPFIVSYVGRHNFSKGYDILKEIGKKYLSVNTNAYFIICGKEGPMYRLNSPRWIEIGWTNNADSYIKSSDVFILPNRVTYFDLVLLEVLSIGKIVLISYTGGNKFFKQFKDTGIFFYNDIQDACEKLDYISKLTRKQREDLGKKNYELYEKMFTCEIFSNRYANFYKDVLNGEVKKEY